MKDINKSQIERLMANRYQIFPICIPSYKRWDRKANTTLTKIIENCDEEIQRNTYVFVREEQAEAYRESFKTVNIVVLPPVNGLAGTRQYIVDYVAETLGKPYFVDLDDDITDLKFVWHDAEGDHLSKKEETNYSKILRFGCAISRMAFGSGDGLCGWNCYHNFYPYILGFSTPTFSSERSKNNDAEYETQQEQRAIERAIRSSKKEVLALDAARKAATTPETYAQLDEEFSRASRTLASRRKRLETFLDSHSGFFSASDRTAVGGFDRSIASKAVWAAKRAT